MLHGIDTIIIREQTWCEREPMASITMQSRSAVYIPITTSSAIQTRSPVAQSIIISSNISNSRCRLLVTASIPTKVSSPPFGSLLSSAPLSRLLGRIPLVQLLPIDHVRSRVQQSCRSPSQNYCTACLSIIRGSRFCSHTNDRQ